MFKFGAWFRCWQTRIDGSKTRPKIVIGSLEEYPNESPARIAVYALRITISEQTPRQQLKQISIATLVEHYREHELPDIFYKTPPTDDEPEERIIDPHDFADFVKQRSRAVVGSRLNAEGLWFVQNFVFPPKHAPASQKAREYVRSRK
jgi:hypothetical protein